MSEFFGVDDKDLLKRANEMLKTSPELHHLFRDINNVLQSDLSRQFTTLTGEEKANARLMAQKIGRFIDEQGWREKYGDKAILNMFMSMERASLLLMERKMRKKMR